MPTPSKSKSAAAKPTPAKDASAKAASTKPAAKAVSKAVEAFQALRKGIVTFRDSVGSTDKAAITKAKNDIQQASQTFDALISEQQRLQGKADEIARRNPDKIKPGQ